MREVEFDRCTLAAADTALENGLAGDGTVALTLDADPPDDRGGRLAGCGHRTGEVPSRGALEGSREAFDAVVGSADAVLDPSAEQAAALAVIREQTCGLSSRERKSELCGRGEGAANASAVTLARTTRR